VRILLDTDTNYRAYPLPQLTSCSATRGSKRKKEKKSKRKESRANRYASMWKKRLRHFHAGSTVRGLKKKKGERERKREKKRKINSKRNIVRYYRIRASTSECQSILRIIARVYAVSSHSFRIIRRFALPCELFNLAIVCRFMIRYVSAFDVCSAYLIDLIVVTECLPAFSFLLWMFVTRGSSRKKRKKEEKKRKERYGKVSISTANRFD